MRGVGDDMKCSLPSSPWTEVLSDQPPHAHVGELLAGFPTSATAVFAYDGAWADLAEGSARLVGYHVGRG